MQEGHHLPARVVRIGLRLCGGKCHAVSEGGERGWCVYKYDHVPRSFLFGIDNLLSDHPPKVDNSDPSMLSILATALAYMASVTAQDTLSAATVSAQGALYTLPPSPLPACAVSEIIVFCMPSTALATGMLALEISEDREEDLIEVQ